MYNKCLYNNTNKAAVVKTIKYKRGNYVLKFVLFLRIVVRDHQ